MKIFKRLIFLVVLLCLLGSYTETFSQIPIIIDKAEKEEDLRKKSSTYLYLAEYYCEFQKDSALFFLKDALKYSFLANDSSLISDTYRLYAIAKAPKEISDTVSHYFQQSLKYAIDKVDSAKIYTDIAAAYTYCGDYNKAFKCYNIGVDYMIQINDSTNLARILTNLGVLYSKTSKFYQASTTYMRALDICEKYNDKESAAGIYNNMGEIMALQEEYDKAIGYFSTAKSLYESLGLIPPLSTEYLNLAQVYIELEEYDIAKDYLNKSYQIDTTYKLKALEANSLRQLATVYLRQGKYNSAERLIDGSIYVLESESLNMHLEITKILKAEILVKQKRFDEANKIILENEPIIRRQNDQHTLVHILNLKAEIAKNSGQWDSAYNFQEEAYTISDSLYGVDKHRSIMNLEIAYQTELKEKQIEQLKYSDSLKKIKLKNRSRLITLLIIILALVIIITGFLILYWIKKQQYENQNREKRILQAKFNAEGQQQDKIAQELHDNVGGKLIGLILKLQSGNIDNDESLHYVEDIYKDIRRVSHSLNEPIFKNVDLQTKVQNYISTLTEDSFIDIDYTNDIDIDWSKVIDNIDLQRNCYRMIQELLTNSFKHAKADHIEIHLLNDDTKIMIIYEDNGVGFSKEAIMRKDLLSTIKKRLDIFDGKIDINNSHHKGVFINITIPYKKNK
jgi:signal transduction histidine kinase/Tfp pilus assembly protein PilF